MSIPKLLKNLSLLCTYTVAAKEQMFCPNLKITKTSFGFYGQLLSSVSLSELARKADEIGNTLLEYVFSVQIPVLYTVGL